MKKYVIGLALFLVVVSLSLIASEGIEQVFLCSKCSTTVIKPSMPNNANCPAKGSHKWNKLGDLGIQPYLCTKCSIKVYTEKIPNNQNCPDGGSHQWNKL